MLLDAGASPGALSGIWDKGEEALSRACAAGHIEIAQLLLEARFPCCDMTLFSTCYSGHLELAKKLLEAGIGHGLEAVEALHHAAGVGDAEAVRLLLSAEYMGTYADQMDRCLVSSCHDGYLEIAHLLLEAGVDKDSVDPSGKTGLICACDQGHMEIIQLLLAAGANVNLKDHNGQTALNCADDKGFADIAILLRAAGAVGGRCRPIITGKRTFITKSELMLLWPERFAA